MHFPPWVGAAVDTDTVEPIRKVDAQRSEWGYKGSTEARTAIHPGRVELAGLPVQVGCVQEGVDVHRLADAGAGLEGEGAEGPSEGVRARRRRAGSGAEAVGSDGELLIAAQRDAE